jgi:hypothetical protein
MDKHRREEKRGLLNLYRAYCSSPNIPRVMKSRGIALVRHVA